MKNIYQAAREAAGMTQERAAELIGLSVESIRSYETEKRIPADETVIKWQRSTAERITWHTST